MITWKDFYNILTALVPLYAVMILAYGAVRWWKVFTSDHCAGINRFVGTFSVPLLLFDFIANNNPYAINQKFIAADSFQKVVILLFLCIWFMVSKQGSIDWVITIFSLTTLPNTLIIGVPLLEAMYGEYSGKLMVQIVFMQCLVWINVVLIFLEYRGAMILISKKFPSSAGSISSFSVKPDVNTLNEEDIVDADADISEDGKLSVSIRRSFHLDINSNTKSKSMNSVMSSEIYSEHSFRETSPRGLNTDNLSRSADLIDYDVSNDVNRDQGATKVVKVDDGENSVKVGDIEGGVGGKNRNHQMPPVRVLTKLILVMVWRRMIRIPSTYATLFGLVWSLLAFKFGFSMPKIMSKSISILSTTGLGLSMFSLGLFLASQTKMIACGKKVATFAMVARFLAGPAVAAATAAAVGLRGDLLRISIIQAALPLAVISFVFAKEYNVQADIISTSVSFSLILALPVTILYYVLLGL